MIANHYLRGAFAVLFFSTAALLGAQKPRPLLTPITREEVWQAIVSEQHQRGVSDEQLLAAEEIDLPAAVPAPFSRTLRVSMVCWDADLARAQFQLECREPGHCIPFLAYADAAQSTAMGSARTAGSSCRNAVRPRQISLAPHKNVIRSGDRATVVFRGSRFNLTTLVTYLERGAEGTIIRVRSMDGRIFRARVTGPATLEALSQPITPILKETK